MTDSFFAWNAILNRFVSREIHARRSRRARFQSFLIWAKIGKWFSLVGNNPQHDSKRIGEVTRFKVISFWRIPRLAVSVSDYGSWSNNIVLYVCMSISINDSFHFCSSKTSFVSKTCAVVCCLVVLKLEELNVLVELRIVRDILAWRSYQYSSFVLFYHCLDQLILRHLLAIIGKINSKKQLSS